MNLDGNSQDISAPKPIFAAPFGTILSESASRHVLLGNLEGKLAAVAKQLNGEHADEECEEAVRAAEEYVASFPADRERIMGSRAFKKNQHVPR